jgi:hypothetical protein
MTPAEIAAEIAAELRYRAQCNRDLTSGAAHDAYWHRHEQLLAAKARRKSDALERLAQRDLRALNIEASRATGGAV